MLEPDDVLAIWVAAHGPLDETKAAAFLARPELDQLCSLPRDVVTSAIASSPKLTVALEQTRRPTPEPIPTPGGPSDDDAEFEAEARHHLRALTRNDDADFRDGQLDAIHALVVERRRTLVVQRTGWGKSAVYFLATPVGFGTLVWRARMVKALARGESTAEAEAEFRTLADRISEPELRWWFERQPLAPN